MLLGKFMNIDTMLLECFIFLAETKSFTKTAERVGCTQSAVSQQINKLENMLGKSLLVRSRVLQLTVDGELFLSYARPIYALHKQALDRFTKPELEGEVKFGLPENFAHIYLQDILSDFIRIYPRILLNVECDLTLNLFEKFKKNELDLVLIKMNCPKGFPNGVGVWSEPLKWVGDDHLVRADKPVPLVLSPHPCVYRTAALSALEQARRPWRMVFSSASYTSTLAATQAGLGITAIPSRMIPKHLNVIVTDLLPDLPHTHLSLLKKRPDHDVINTLESFVFKKLHHAHETNMLF